MFLAYPWTVCTLNPKRRPICFSEHPLTSSSSTLRSRGASSAWSRFSLPGRLDGFCMIKCPCVLELQDRAHERNQSPHVEQSGPAQTFAVETLRESKRNPMEAVTRIPRVSANGWKNCGTCAGSLGHGLDNQYCFLSGMDEAHDFHRSRRYWPVASAITVIARRLNLPNAPANLVFGVRFGVRIILVTWVLLAIDLEMLPNIRMIRQSRHLGCRRLVPAAHAIQPLLLLTCMRL